MSYSQLLFRFVLGGSVVVGVSLLSQHAGNGLAGRFMTIPALTALSLLFVCLDKGAGTASVVAKAGLIGLLPVAAYLIAASWAFGRGLPLWQTYGLSLGIWAAGVALLQVADAASVVWVAGVFSTGWLARSWRSHPAIAACSSAAACIGLFEVLLHVAGLNDLMARVYGVVAGSSVAVMVLITVVTRPQYVLAITTVER